MPRLLSGGESKSGPRRSTASPGLIPGTWWIPLHPSIRRGMSRGICSFSDMNTTSVLEAEIFNSNLSIVLTIYDISPPVRPGSVIAQGHSVHPLIMEHPISISIAVCNTLCFTSPRTELYRTLLVTSSRTWSPSWSTYMRNLSDNSPQWIGYPSTSFSTNLLNNWPGRELKALAISKDTPPLSYSSILFPNPPDHVNHRSPMSSEYWCS